MRHEIRRKERDEVKCLKYGMVRWCKQMLVSIDSRPQLGHMSFLFSLFSLLFAARMPFYPLFHLPNALQGLIFSHRKRLSKEVKMAKTKLQGNIINTVGSLPRLGSKARDFKLTGKDLQDKTLADFTGKRLLLNIFPSIDTGVCAMSVRKFNAEAAKVKNALILGVSRDLPFALGRFCGAEGIDRVITLSDLRDRSFGRYYGLEIKDGPMAGLLARAVLIIDEEGKVIYRELVDDIVHEPDYKAALKALKA
jgi:thiol peroxidase